MTLIDRSFQLAFRLAYPLVLALNFVLRQESRGVWVAVWSEGRILVIKNSYRRCLTLPGGSLGRNEGAATAAVRELQEEV